MATKQQEATATEPNVNVTETIDIEKLEVMQRFEAAKIPEPIDFTDSDIPKKHREVLKAAAAYQYHPEGSISSIVNETDTDRYLVVQILGRYLEPSQIPRKETYAKSVKCVFDKKYEDLTETQQRIVNEAILHPEMSPNQIAKRVGVSEQYSYSVYYTFRHIIEPRQKMQTFNP